jgi:16S rRNA processing protein RimM
MDRIKLGRITGAAGIKGEVKAYLYTDDKDQFSKVPYVLVGNEKLNIRGVRYKKNVAVLSLEGIDDRSTAERYRDCDIYILKADALPLPSDTYYVKDLIGLTVTEDDTGEKLGILSDVIKNKSQDIYQVTPFDGKNPFLIPAVEEFIKAIDIGGGVVKVHLIEGLRQP